MNTNVAKLGLLAVVLVCTTAANLAGELSAGDYKAVVFAVVGYVMGNGVAVWKGTGAAPLFQRRIDGEGGPA